MNKLAGISRMLICGFEDRAMRQHFDRQYHRVGCASTDSILQAKKWNHDSRERADVCSPHVKLKVIASCEIRSLDLSVVVHLQS